MRPKSRARKQSAPPPLRLEWRDPAELADNPANWRTHPEPQRLALEAAIKEVGWAGAALFNETTGHLIDGHLRKKVAAGPVPVLVGSWTEEQERLILATLDPLAAAAEADGAALAALLASVRTEDEYLAALLATLSEAPGPVLPGRNGDEVTDVYQGMPEFVQDDLTGKFKVIVHFEDEAALEGFGRLVSQKMHGRATQAIWYPYKEPQPHGFVAEDGQDEP